MAADYAISQFRFLERLLFVHGHWSYRRISLTVSSNTVKELNLFHATCSFDWFHSCNYLQINYSIWKVVMHGLMLFYSSSVSFWTGQLLFDQWFSSFYNTLFTAFPVGAVGATDQVGNNLRSTFPCAWFFYLIIPGMTFFLKDVTANECLRHPQLYRQGQRNELFNWRRIFGWLFFSLYASLIIFVIPLYSFGFGSINWNGKCSSLQVSEAMLLAAKFLIICISKSYFVFAGPWPCFLHSSCRHRKPRSIHCCFIF